MPNPVPEKICPEDVFDEVTYGYVPKSISSKEPWAPSNNINLFCFPASFIIFHIGALKFIISFEILIKSLNAFS